MAMQTANANEVIHNLANLWNYVICSITFKPIKNSAIQSQAICNVCNSEVSVTNFIYNGLVAVENLIAHDSEFVDNFFLKLWNTVKSTVRATVEVIKKIVDAVIGWIKSMIANGVKALMNRLKEMADSIIDGIRRSLKGMALDIVNENKDEIGGDIVEVLRKVTVLVWGVTTAFVTFAAMEVAIDASSDGIAALVSGFIESLLKDEVIRAIVNVFLSADATVTALNKVAERTGYGISEGVIKNLLKSFDIAVAIEGEIWSVYKMFEESEQRKIVILRRIGIGGGEYHGGDGG